MLFEATCICVLVGNNHGGLGYQWLQGLEFDSDPGYEHDIFIKSTSLREMHENRSNYISLKNNMKSHNSA